MLKNISRTLKCSGQIGLKEHLVEALSYIWGTVCREKKRLLSSGSNGTVEWLTIHLVQLNIILSCIYRPPLCSLPKFEPVINVMKPELDSLVSPTLTIIVCGDFNFPNISWKQHALISGGTTEAQSQAKILKDLMSAYFLDQLILEETRQNNILDLFLTNNTDFVNNILVHNTSLSDHRLIILETNVHSRNCNRISRPARTSDLANLNFFHRELPWEDINLKLSEIN